MTTREKGTGLGLAIVRKDHRGAWRPDRAARCARGRRAAAMGRSSASRCPDAARRRRRPAMLRPCTEGRATLPSDRWRPTSSSSTTRPTSASSYPASSATKGTARGRPRDADGALAEIAKRRPSLIFLDIWLQGSRIDGLALLDAIQRDNADIPIVMISGHGNIETAVSAIKRGAYDYIEKPFKADRLVLVAERALESSKLRREITELRERSRRGRGLVGASAGRQPAPPADREGRADQQPGHDLRPVGLGQGAGRADHPLAVAARQRAVRGRSMPPTITPERMEQELFGTEANGDGRREGRRARGGAWRHALSRRSRRHAARDAEQDPPRARRPDAFSASAAPPGSTSTSASSPRPRATSSARSPRARSARTCSIASRWCRSGFRRWPSGARTSRRLSST